MQGGHGLRIPEHIPLSGSGSHIFVKSMTDPSYSLQDD
jgi:hypothetical protein